MISRLRSAVPTGTVDLVITTEYLEINAPICFATP
jgi:hypothetical protein